MASPALQTIRDEHDALAAMVRSLAMLVERGSQGDAPRFFEVVRAMLFCPIVRTAPAPIGVGAG